MNKGEFQKSCPGCGSNPCICNKNRGSGMSPSCPRCGQGMDKCACQKDWQT
jgi:hypothetical protein